MMSDTRWGSRIKTVSAFISKLEPTHSALQEIESDCTHNSEKANRLRNSVESFDTIITSVVTQNVLGYIWPLTLKLQSPDVDLSSAKKKKEDKWQKSLRALTMRKDSAKYINKQCSWQTPLMLHL